MGWVSIRLGNFFQRIFSNERNLQSCTECYCGPLVVAADDPNGLVCSMCMHRYRSGALRDVYDITVFIDSKAGPVQRELLSYLLGTMGDGFSGRVGADCLGMMEFFRDREKAIKAKKVADAINRSEIKGVSARFRMRSGWSYYGPFVTTVPDNRPSRWGRLTTGGVDWVLRLSGLYGLFEGLRNCMFWRNSPYGESVAVRRESLHDFRYLPLRVGGWK